MDQLASAHGVRGALLPILCRPDVLGEPVRLPPGIVAVGWPSGVKHAVTASPYATARAGAFMGKKLIEHATGRRLAHAAELTPAEVRSFSGAVLPETVSGRAFLARCGGVDDPLSRIEPAKVYAVRAAVSFPVEESFRSQAVVALLRGAAAKHREETLRAMGELLFQSHAGYSSIGLGCPETDAMVAAVRALGPGRGFYGARVSGGGSGGTVVVLLRKAALPELRRLAARLRFGREKLPLLQ
jgi:L-arabinokinase